MNLKTRIKIEKAIVKAIVTNAIELGYTVSVYDGEEWCLRRSDDVKTIIAATFSTDLDCLCFREKTDEAKRVGTVQLVYGNDGFDVISDYTSNDTMETILSKANALAKELELKHT